jgi:Zinc finger C-x8-C-x5-C-x3-H type (and similar)/Nuclear fragile X mental retardation-interacting protein 1 (NUFIP1)
MSYNKQTSSSYPAGFYASGSNGARNNPRIPPPPPPPPYGSQHQQFLYNYSGIPNQRQAHAHNIYARGYAVNPPPPPPPPPHAATPSPLSPPPKQIFRCTSCNLTLDSGAALAAHTQTHIQCTACSFTGAPKVVRGHHAAVHGKFAGSGYKTVTVAVPGCQVQRFRICVGNRPEDIQQWIADRRKRFPRQTKKDDDDGNKVGISSLLAGYGSSSSDDNDDYDHDDAIKNDNNEKEKAATSSHCTNKQIEGKKDAPIEPQERLCRFFQRNGQCRHGEKCHFSHEESGTPHPQHSAGTKRIRPHSQISSSAPVKKTLLEKLLAKDIEREAALTIQLLDYLVDSNFLRKEPDC